jgi:hypothetical protein
MPHGDLVSHTMSSRGQHFVRSTDCLKAVANISVGGEISFFGPHEKRDGLNMMLPQTKILSLFTTQLYIR